MLELRGITKRYRGITAVENISFQAKPGAVTGYLGPNGSGKSTTVKMITGLLEPTEGQILWNGEPIHSHLLAFKRQLGYVPEEPHLYPHLTGGEYLQMTAELRMIPVAVARERTERFLTLLGMWEDRWSAISSYSKGMKQKILLTAALLHDPQLIILDEPFSGLDVHSSLVLRELIRGLAASGRTVLFSSHELDTVERVSSHVIILYKGQVVANDSVEHLRSLMSKSSLEEIFTQLAVRQNPHEVANGLMEALRS